MNSLKNLVELDFFEELSDAESASISGGLGASVSAVTGTLGINADKSSGLIVTTTGLTGGATTTLSKDGLNVDGYGAAGPVNLNVTQ